MKAEGPTLPMYKTYYESAPGVIRSTGELAISRFWQGSLYPSLNRNNWGKIFRNHPACTAL